MRYKYSIIIPIYNAEATLRRCLDSLVKQAQGVAEIILINDGSKDNSLSVCRDYENQYDNIKVIDQHNSGASAARNAGLDIASGKFVTFVDSDDYVPNNYFAILDENQEKDFIIYPFFRKRDNSIVSVELPHDIYQASSNEDRIICIIRNRFASPWNKRFQYDIIEKYHIRFKKDLVIGEDFVFGLEYMLHCKSSSAGTDLLYYVDESGVSSITRSPKYDCSQFVKIYEYAFKAAEQCNWSITYQTKLLQQLDYLYCRTAFAVVDHQINSGNTGKMSTEEVIRLFYNHCRWDLKPINWIHSVMKNCIHKKSVLAFKSVVAFRQLLAH